MFYEWQTVPQIIPCPARFSVQSVTMENSKLTRLSVKSSKPTKTSIDFDNIISSQVLNLLKG